MFDLKRRWFIPVLLLMTGCFLFSSGEKAPNSLENIDRCEGKIKLVPIRVWGGDEEDDEQKFFKKPVDIEINQKGFIYILDSRLRRVQLFDAAGKYVKTIGCKGQGPGEFQYPGVMALDRNDNLFVSDISRRKIHIFDSRGSYMSSLATNSPIHTLCLTRTGEIAAIERLSASYHNAHLVLLDGQGKIRREICKFFFKIGQGGWDSVTFVMDKEESFYVAYIGTPLIRKFANSGQHIMDINYEVPFKSYHRLVPLPGGKDIEIIAEKTEILVYGLASDEKGRILLVVKTRPLDEKEKRLYQTMVVQTAGGDMGTIEEKKGADSDRTDLFRLLVFDESGRVTAARKLDVFCDMIALNKDRLFVVDSTVGARIYEYRIVYH